MRPEYRWETPPHVREVNVVDFWNLKRVQNKSDYRYFRRWCQQTFEWSTRDHLSGILPEYLLAYTKTYITTRGTWSRIYGIEYLMNVKLV